MSEILICTDENITAVDAEFCAESAAIKKYQMLVFLTLLEIKSDLQ